MVSITTMSSFSSNLLLSSGSAAPAPPGRLGAPKTDCLRFSTMVDIMWPTPWMDRRTFLPEELGTEGGQRGCTAGAPSLTLTAAGQSHTKEGAGLTREGFLEEGSFKSNLGKGRARAKVSCVGRSVRILMWEIMTPATKHEKPRGHCVESTKNQVSVCLFS